MTEHNQILITALAGDIIKSATRAMDGLKATPADLAVAMVQATATLTAAGAVPGAEEEAVVDASSLMAAIAPMIAQSVKDAQAMMKRGAA